MQVELENMPRACCAVGRPTIPLWAVAAYKKIKDGEVDTINSEILIFKGTAPRLDRGVWRGDSPPRCIPLWVFRLARPDIDLGAGDWSMINFTPKVLYDPSGVVAAAATSATL